MPTREYIAQLNESPRARMRIRFTTDAGTVTEFLAQLELRERGIWAPVIRYDGVHGFAHRDRYRRNGEQVKEVLNLSYADAMTYGISDMRTNWPTYIERFLRGDFA